MQKKKNFMMQFIRGRSNELNWLRGRKLEKDSVSVLFVGDWSVTHVFLSVMRWICVLNVRTG